VQLWHYLKIVDMKGIWIVCLLFLVQACSSSGPNRAALQKKVEQTVVALETGDLTKVDTAKANALIETSLQFVEAYPRDSLSPIYLFRAADVSVGVGKPEQAIALWGNFQRQYPEHERAPAALFFQGFTCDNQLSDKERSANYYKKFLSQYPEHELAEQAKLLLEQLSLSPEELIRQFKENEGI
jgi:outer membrane protein assembly factor BamD (BamD/ComL family)